MYVIENILNGKFWSSSKREFVTLLSGEFKRYTGKRAARIAVVKLTRSGFEVQMIEEPAAPARPMSWIAAEVQS
jgi:hypothetical protein